MCGSANTVVRGVEAVATGGLSEFTHGTDAFGLKTGLKALGFGGKAYTPQLLPTTDPAMMLAQSGGASLLTTVALGGSVDDAVAGYFGRKGGDDFNAWYKSQSPDQQAAIDGVKTQLTQIQTNTDLRNKAVQQVVQDFPNIVSMTAPKVMEAKKAAGEEFDSATKGYLDYALRSVAAKAGANGTVSSGATVQASADAAAKLGLDRLSYTSSEGDKALGLLNQDWQNQYTEANALRSFQQKMLGQGSSQGFSAIQSSLARKQNTDMANTGAVNQANAAKTAADNAFDSQILSTAGTVALFGASGGSSGAAKAAAPAAPKTALADFGNDGYRSA